MRWAVVLVDTELHRPVIRVPLQHLLPCSQKCSHLFMTGLWLSILSSEVGYPTTLVFLGEAYVKYQTIWFEIYSETSIQGSLTCHLCLNTSNNGK